jgi:RteC protein.
MSELEQYVQELWPKVEVETRAVTSPSADIAEAMTHIAQTRMLIDQLNLFMLEHGFQDTAEEIRYFKFVFPKFLGNLAFQVRITRLRAETPPWPHSLKTQIREREIRRITRYLDREKELYRYMKLGLTHLDDRLFLRSAAANPIQEACMLMDTRLYTPASVTLARFIGYELLLNFIETNGFDTPSGATSSETTITWTAQKTQLAELIYALVAIRAFGNQPTILVAETIAKQWNIHLTYIHKTFEEIRLRKKNRTPFIDFLKTALLNRMEEDDDKYDNTNR